MTKTKQAQVTWGNPHEIDDVTAMFPACVSGTLLPPMDKIPQEFKSSRNPWCELVSSLFFRGGALPSCKAGVDARMAERHLMAVLGSFEPAHEHKTAGAAWLMSMWYAEPKPKK